MAGVLRRLAGRVGRSMSFMGFCGTHEWTFTYFGLRSLLPRDLRVVAGPGCPVCITPGSYVDTAVKLSLDGVKILTYGDAYKLPGSELGRPRSLAEARAEGGSVQVVYGFTDALRIARRSRGLHVFLGIGFETTAPSVASPISRGEVPGNLLVLSAYRLTPPIMEYMLSSVKDVPIDGVIAPGHVSAIIGAKSWGFVAEKYHRPVVVAGFEPLDVMLALLEMVAQVIRGEARLVNEYKRLATWEGNLRAQRVMAEVFSVVDAGWRGIGVVPGSGYVFSDKYSRYDAAVQLGLEKELRRIDEMPGGCRCADVVLGRASPIDCPLFGKACTPSHPYGPCMVSREGTCYIWARYGGPELLRSRD